MAIYNEILAPRFARFFQKHFSMKGSTAVRQLAGEVSVSLPIWSGIENRWLESWERFAANLAVAAVAAQVSNSQLRNPAGSNVVMVLEMASIEVDVADFVIVSMAAQATDLTTTVAGFRLDPRG